MPHISVKLIPGRSEQLKKQLAEKIVQDVVFVLRCGEESVSLTIQEIDACDWTEEVYKPEIQNNPNLYKKPGYNPLG